jgi:hypothetical protein
MGRAGRRPLHVDDDVHLGAPITKNGLEDNAFDERMDIGFQEILTEQDFVGQKIVLAEIRQVISEFAQGLHDSADIGSSWFDEKVDI